MNLIALKASAGTGKTYSLALYYLARLFEGANPYDIVAITFTNKAANEMRERVIDFLFDLDEEKLEQIASIIQKDPKTLSMKQQQVIRKFLVSRLNILTIDAFVQKILRKFAFFASLSPDFTIETIEVFESFINALEEKEFMRLTNFAKWFGQSGIGTFFDTLYEKDKELPAVQCTIQDNMEEVLSLYHKIVEHIHNVGTEAKKRDFQPVARVEEFLFTKSGGIRAWLMKEEFKIPGVPASHEVQEIFVQLKNAIKKYYDFKEAKFLQTLFDYYEQFKIQRKRLIAQRNALDFTDIKHYTYDLLQDSIEKDFLYFRLDSKISHILFDEFQDTSVEDWKIFEPLVDEIASGMGVQEQRSFFYVGDVKQAIYGFRGGQAELFDWVARRYGMQIEELDVNYRSRSNIVEYVNEMFGLEQKSDKTGGYVEVRESESLLEDLQAKVQMLLDSGVQEDQIAILVPTNNDVFQVADFLQESLGLKATTSSSKLLIHQPYAKAIIEAIKYIYSKEKIHLFNFQSVASQELDTFKEHKPVQLIRKIADRYDLWDDSVLELLEHSVTYKDIEEFVEKIDQCGIEVQSASQGVEVLTVHKSKGLAFEHTIVLDRLGLDRSRKENIIFDYEGIDLKRVVLRQKGREQFDQEYRQLLEKEEQKELQELRNVAYVALTRAKDSLIVLKNPNSKRYGFLQETRRGEVVAQKSGNDEKIVPFAWKMRNYGKQEIIEEAEYRPNDFKAIYKGEAYHQSLEIGFAYAKSRFALLSDLEHMQEEVEKVQEMIEKRFKPICYKEIPFVSGDKLGIIDLLIEEDERYIIIDYKSTRPHDESGYIKQVQFYKESIEKITGKKAEGYLLYIDELQLKKV
ncbi:RecB-like helicase [Nitratiruptor sp. SB155-2]|uniref:RecB-like helicase n=1 Tax=Nitratiruptor sp. (strain SB155-2) TaxID=387092 RepID=UPI0001586E70|nr:RecB-like helicase [Nitratiruptor sp. SB155-2]BAF69480.1 ATP-dependent DNA helicase, UvrD/REP family [Nitratiruptor sp. SB155-2]